MNIEQIQKDIEVLKSNPNTMYKGQLLSRELNEIIQKLEYLQEEINDVNSENKDK